MTSTLSTELARWILVALVALALAVSGPWLDGPSDAEAQADLQAELRDAVAQAQAERPDLWDAEAKARAHAAIATVLAARQTEARR